MPSLRPALGTTQGDNSSSWPISLPMHGAEKNAAAISPIALEAVKRIAPLFDIEGDINGLSAEERLSVRKEQSGPFWLLGNRGCVRRSSGCRALMRYYYLRHL